MSTAANFEGIKVVIIDEYKTIRRTAETLLKKAGCQVVTTRDGFEGFYRIIEFKPDIIFVGHHPIYPIYVMPDHRMPCPLGYQTCALIKSNQAFKSVPVIILSSCDGLFERARSQIVGATHYMTLPFTREELLYVIKIYVGVKRNPPNSDYFKRRGRKVSTTTNFEGIKVVIIDCHETIRRTIETLLKKAGCQVVTASDGFEGLSRIMEFQPNIIFVDDMMPRLNGYQTCILIRSNPVFKPVPVIILSCWDGLVERARSQIVGATHYMTYPFTREELLDVVKSYVVDIKKS